MRAPLGGGGSEPLFAISPGDANLQIHCPTRPGRPCVMSRLQDQALVFYELDPMKGQGPEVARTVVGKPGDPLFWNLSQDGAQIALAGPDTMSRNVRIIDLKNHKQRDLPSPVLIQGICWSFDGRGLYITGQTREFMVIWLDLTGKSKILLNKGGLPWFVGPVASPDGRMLVFSKQSNDVNLFLLEHF